jgi:pimeloyl-ACP methyl ester carboxylesterase
MTITEGRITANGLEFGYLAAGDQGPLALCAHGFPDSARTWELLLPDLAAAGFRAVAPWLRGYAPTEVPADGLYQPGAIASDLNALHEALGGDDRAVLIGHDWGAMASYLAVAHAPGQWRRLVTAAVPPAGAVGRGFFSYAQLQRSWYIWFFQTPFAEMAVSLDDLAFIDRLWGDWSPGFDGSAWSAHCRDSLRDPANLAAAIGYYRATVGSGTRAPAYDAVEATGGAPLPVPTLYLHGVDDGCMGSELITDEILAELPVAGSRLELVPGSGHFLHLERPEIVNPLIVDFVTAT